MKIKIISWNKAKTKAHDISGISNPENYLYKKIFGVYYPILD